MVGLSPLTYTIVVSNVGGQTAGPSHLLDLPPANFAYSSFATTAGSCSILGSLSGQLDCDLPAIPSGGSITVTVIGAITTQSQATNTVVVDAFGQVDRSERVKQPGPSDNNVSPPPTPTPTATLLPGDFALTKVDRPDPFVAGEALTYTVTVTNGGQLAIGSAATPIRLFDTVCSVSNCDPSP